jgi:uncharacterized RDD family membrane protein YckC
MVSTATSRARRTAASSADVHVTGRRIAATAVDGLFIGSLYGVMAAFVGTVTDRGEFFWTASMPAAANVAYGVLVVAYYLVLEGFRGQTLGKMLVGVRVVDARTGDRPRFRAVAIRTALRVVDGIATYLVAFLTVLLTARRQRLGDLAAGTLVVADR